MLCCARAARDELGDFDAGGFELLNFVGIIREQANGLHAEGFQSVGGEFVVAGIVGEAELAISFDGVEAGILKLVGFQLVDQANAAALLRQIQNNSSFGLGDAFEREFELRTAIAAFGSEDVAGKALRVDANQRSFRTRQVAVADGDGFFVFFSALDAMNGEAAVARRQVGRGDDVRAAFARRFLLRFHSRLLV